jgi:glyoxylase-like metal-dependent hydrolase (beta-lactamase superfamily II)
VTDSDRRAFLKAAVAGAAGVSLSLRTFARAAPEPVVAVPLSEHVVQITGVGGNVVVLTGSDSVVMVDSGDEDRAKDLMRAVEKLPGGKRVATLINTHWHYDHTGGNERFGKEKVKILAHENTKLWLGADFYCEWQDNKHYTPRPKLAWPTVGSGRPGHGG